MGFAQGREIHFRRRLELRRRRGAGAPTGTEVGLVVGAGVKEQGEFIATLEDERVALDPAFATTGSEAQLGGMAERVRHGTCEAQAIGARAGGRALGGLQRDATAQRAGFVGRVVEHQDLVGMARQRLAGELRSVPAEARRVDAGAEVQFAPVIRWRVRRCRVIRLPPIDGKIAEVAVIAEPVVAGLEVAVPVVVTGPKALLVELDDLLDHAAEGHRAEATVADGIAFLRPIRCRLIGEQGVGGGWGSRSSDGRRRRQQGKAQQE